MKAFLRQDDVNLVEDKLRQFEASTGCELLVIIAKSSDPYPAAAWRFGIITGLVIGLIFSHYFEFTHTYLWPLTFFLTTLLMVWIGHFDWAKRLCLSDWEVERECEEKALELFHTMGTSKVEHKVTAMIMVSTLERKIEVLVDHDLKERLTKEDLDELVESMKKHFHDGHMASGLVDSIQGLEKKILATFGGRVSHHSPDELSNTIHFI